MTRLDLVLGVDGGGSRTRAWLALRDHADESDSGDESGVVGRGTAAASNPRTTPHEMAARNIQQAVHAAFDDYGVARQRVAAACICLAGADREAERVPIRRWAEQLQLAQHIVITNDAMPILYAKDEQGIGVALISGTGSVAWGRGASGQTCRAGGWGPILGDEGSGYSIARAGLRAAAKSADGRGQATDLLDRFLTHLQISTAMELIPKIYADGFGRPEIARMASIVFQADAAGDSVAGKIVDRAAEELALAAISVATRLKLPAGGWVLSVSGGVLLNQADFRARLLSRLSESSSPPRQLVAVDQPVAGAVRLARMHPR
jgi:N-acetylglucosamine kinase-like BadF-type ATPase